MVETYRTSNKHMHDKIELLQQQIENLNKQVPPPTIDNNHNNIVKDITAIIPPILSITPEPLHTSRISSSSSSSSSTSIVHQNSVSSSISIEQYNHLQEQINKLTKEIKEFTIHSTEVNSALAHDIQELNKYISTISNDVQSNQQSNQLKFENLQQMILNNDNNTIQRIGKQETELNQRIQDKFENLRNLVHHNDQNFITQIIQNNEEYQKLYNTIEHTIKHHKTRLDALAAAIHAFAGVLSIGQSLFTNNSNLK